MWKTLEGEAKRYFDYYKKLPWVEEHHYNALARGCLAAAELDSFGEYNISQHDKYKKVDRSTPEAMEVRKLRQLVENFNRDFGLTPYAERIIGKGVKKPAKTGTKTRRGLRKAQ